MSDDPILAAIQATKYAEAIMRRSASDYLPTENFGGDQVPPHLTKDAPHDDWQPKFKNDPAFSVQKWHPPYGETHVKYHIYRAGGGRNPIIWGANHHGTYQGSEMVKSPIRPDDYPDIMVSKYSNQDDPEQLGRFKTPEKAKAAAEAHYRDNYSQPPKHDYDIDKIMGQEPSSGGKRGLGDDEDYGHIFGMHARLAARAASVDRGVMGRIAAELSPPCPDCGQVAGFDEHMVSPRVKVCRNCDYPMTDIGHDGLLEGILRGHDQSIADLPETDHPTLGKHGRYVRSQYDDLPPLPDDFHIPDSPEGQPDRSPGWLHRQFVSPHKGVWDIPEHELDDRWNKVYDTLGFDSKTRQEWEAGRNTGNPSDKWDGGMDGTFGGGVKDYLTRAPMSKDEYARHREDSRNRAKGIADGLWGAMYPPEEEEGRKSVQNMDTVNNLMSNGWQPEQIKYDEDDQPYGHYQHPSGWNVSDYGGMYKEIGHAATPGESHDVINTSHNIDGQDYHAPFGPADAQAHIENQLHGDPEETGGVFHQLAQDHPAIKKYKPPTH